MSDVKKINGLEFIRHNGGLIVRSENVASLCFWIDKEGAEHIAKEFGLVHAGEVAADIYHEDVAGLKKDVRRGKATVALAEYAMVDLSKQLRKLRRELESTVESEQAQFDRAKALELDRDEIALNYNRLAKRAEELRNQLNAVRAELEDAKRQNALAGKTIVALAEEQESRPKNVDERLADAERKLADMGYVGDLELQIHDVIVHLRERKELLADQCPVETHETIALAEAENRLFQLGYEGPIEEQLTEVLKRLDDAKIHILSLQHDRSSFLERLEKVRDIVNP